MGETAGPNKQRGNLKCFVVRVTCLETRILFPVERCLFIVLPGAKEKLK